MTSIQIDRIDGLSSSAAIKGPCQVATTANIVLSGLQTIDAVVLANGDRVLVKDQTTASENGIYVVDTGPWRRAKDFSSNKDVVEGTQVRVNAGTLYGSTDWYVSSPDPIVIGTTSIVFTQNVPPTVNLPPIVAGTMLIAKPDASGYDTKFPTDVRDFLDTPAYVATRTAMKALDPTKDKCAVLMESGRAGTFTLRTGSAPFSDTQEGVYITSDTAGYHWERNLEGRDLCPVMFGGGPTGWQAAIDLAYLLGVNVFAQGVCTLTAVSGPLNLRPDVTIHNSHKMARITQANGANLTQLVNWPTNAAHRAGLKGIVIDGNKANNTINANNTLLLQWDVADPFVIDCTLKNSVGIAIHNRAGARPIIRNNRFSDCYGLFVYMSPLTTTLTTVDAEITNNVFDGDWSQHVLQLEYLRGVRVIGNRVIGFAQRGFNVTVTGTAVTSTGSFFSAACVGKFLIYDGGKEALISGFTNANAVTISSATGNCVTQPGVWGNGDVIGFTGCNEVLCQGNTIRGGASIGISIFSNSASLNSINVVVIDNTITSMGSGAIIAQVAGGGSIFDTLIQGNQITDPGVNGTAAATSFNCGVKIAGGANVQRVSVSNNKIISYNVGLMQWAVSYQAGVLDKVTTGGAHFGSVNTTNNSVENP